MELSRGTYFALAFSVVGIIGLAALPQWLASKPRIVVPPSASVPSAAPTPTETASDPPPEPEPVESLLSGYTSLFKTEAKDERVHNITLGAKKIDGKVLRPGVEWSFNDVVGPRTMEAGFKEAPTLFLGEVIPAPGGGMCQVSSTLHAAALLAGFEIVQRHPHSRPSSYIAQGFDATVNYPEHCWGDGEQDPNTCFDLRIRNPYDFPLTIKARVHEPDEPTKVPQKALTIELWGVGPVAKVTTSWKLYSTPPFGQKWRRAWRKGDWKQKKQSGQNGVNGGLTVDTVWPDGRKESRVVYSKYSPVNEVWHVGRDWPEGVNPWEE
jgi:hypothetical protein